MAKMMLNHHQQMNLLVSHSRRGSWVSSKHHVLTRVPGHGSGAYLLHVMPGESTQADSESADHG